MDCSRDILSLKRNRSDARNRAELVADGAVQGHRRCAHLSGIGSVPATTAGDVVAADAGLAIVAQLRVLAVRVRAAYPF